LIPGPSRLPRRTWVARTERRRASKAERDEVARERADADAVLAAERVAETELLHADSEQRIAAVRALLQLERAATDKGLALERRESDAVLSLREEALAIGSHELRNLLNGVILNACMVADDARVDGAQAIAMRTQVIVALSVRMQRLLADRPARRRAARLRHVPPCARARGRRECRERRRRRLADGCVDRSDAIMLSINRSAPIEVPGNVSGCDCARGSCPLVSCRCTRVADPRQLTLQCVRC
jgi:signal transduction histidine kinase